MGVFTDQEEALIERAVSTGLMIFDFLRAVVDGDRAKAENISRKFGKMYALKDRESD